MKWQQTPEAAHCMALEQLNRILAGLIREYGRDGELILSTTFANDIPLGQQITWSCVCDGEVHTIIREKKT